MAAAVGSVQALPEQERAHRGALYCTLAGLLTSLLFAFVVYPLIAGRTGAVLDPDLYGTLGWGFWKYHTFSYYPSQSPTVSRGPLYPLAVAASLQLTGGWWPYGMQVIQCAFMALTCGLTFYIARHFWSPRSAMIAGLAAALHPFLIWYTSRIWIETMAVLLFTAVVAAVLYLQEKPSAASGALLGVVLGLACLCKSTFLPFLILLPLWFWVVKPRTVRWPAMALFGLAAILTISPWTIRNWRLTGRFIPVHDHLGFNLHVGDSFVAHLGESPLAFTPLWKRAGDDAAAIAKRRPTPQDFDGWWNEIPINQVLLRSCLERYAADPLFLVRKIALQSIAFWALSDTAAKTIVVGALQFPLLLLFLGAVVRLARQAGVRSWKLGPVVVCFVYYGLHLPLLAVGRYSVVLVPTMLAYGVGFVLERATASQRVEQSV